MSDPADPPTHLAVHCRYLSHARDAGREDFAGLCLHPAREGTPCVGPFLEDLTTPCGFWESHPQSHLIPLPQPERWQYRRRREGFDLTRAVYRDDWS